MSEKNALILSGSGYELAISTEALAQKAELLKDSALIIEVRDNTAAEAARNQLKKLAAMRNGVEKSRTTIKEPVLAIGRDIDTKAKDFVAEISLEEKRLSGMVADHAAEVERERQRMLREMEDKRRAEESVRLKAEQEAASAARMAEEAKIAANKAFLHEAEDNTETLEANRKAQEAAEASAKAAAELEAAKAQPVAPAFVPAAVHGVKFNYDYEVDDIDALYRFSPLLVKMEPRRAEILQRLNAHTGDGDPVIPGLRIAKKPVVSSR